MSYFKIEYKNGEFEERVTFEADSETLAAVTHVIGILGELDDDGELTITKVVI